MVRTRPLALAALVAASALCGAQTFYGPGGLIINPTAYFTRPGYLQFNSSYFNQQTGTSTTSIFPESITYGASRKLELGGLYVSERTGSNSQSLGGLYVKQGLLEETDRMPAVALVGSSLTGDGTFSSLTLVGSKKLAPGLHLHLGTRYVNDSSDSRTDGNLIGGFDAAFGKNLRLIAEADTRLRKFPVGSEAFGVQYSGSMILTVGLIAQGTSRYSFFIGAGYPIGKP